MDKPVRKIIRLDNYDYSKNGLYFITICTVHKNELLWATDVGDGALYKRDNSAVCVNVEKIYK